VTQETLGPIFGPKFLNTTFADSILYGLKNYYGANQPMSLRIDTSKAPTSILKEGHFGIEVSFDIWVYVKEELAVKIQVLNADGALSANLTKGHLIIQVYELYINNAVAVDCKFGQISVDDIRNAINSLVYLGLPFLNGYLKDGVQLPSEYLGIVSVQDAFFNAKEGYLQVGVSPKFV
jgi:hypothetical protein